MRSVLLHGKGDFRIHDSEAPRPSAGEVLIRLGAVGVCASDVHWYVDGCIGPSLLQRPTILGHEPSGTIEAIGSGVKQVRVGQRVAIEPAKPCLRCEYCGEGHYNVCPNVEFMGVSPVDGAFRELLAWPAALVSPIPDTMTLEEAAMLEPLGVGLHAVNLVRVQETDTVAILGAGAIGLSVLQCLKARGVRSVVVSEPVPERRALAKKLGADGVCIPAGCGDLARDVSGGRGVDVVIECAGETQAVMQSAELARPLGRIVVVGITWDNKYSFPAAEARRKQLSVIFSRRSNRTLEPSIELWSKGAVDLSCFVSQTFPLQRTAEAFEFAAKRQDGLVRAVVLPNQ